MLDLVDGGLVVVESDAGAFSELGFLVEHDNETGAVGEQAELFELFAEKVGLVGFEWVQV